MTISNLDEYQDAEIYDAEYGEYSADFNIFVDHKKEGNALDLACGTGRLTIALAQSGLNCTGLDASQPMLKRAMIKSQGLKIKYLQGDIRDFNLGEHFDLITMGGNAFQALLTIDDQMKMFSCVKNHLRNDALFIFNTRNFNPKELFSTKVFEFWHSFIDHKANCVQVFGKQQYNESKQIMHYSTKRVWPTFETISKISLKFTEVEELKTRLTQLGFEIVELYGDVDKRPFTSQSPAIIFICRCI